MASPEKDADALVAKVETTESTDANEVALPAGNDAQEKTLETAVVTGAPAPAPQQSAESLRVVHQVDGDLGETNWNESEKHAAVLIQSSARKDIANQRVAVIEAEKNVAPGPAKPVLFAEPKPPSAEPVKEDSTSDEEFSHRVNNDRISKMLIEAEKDRKKLHEWPSPLSVEACEFATDLLPANGGSKESLRVFACTWNMHGKGAPSPENLKRILPPNMCHVYVVATQECEVTAQSSVYHLNQLKFPKAVKACLGDRYFVVRGQALAAINLTVFAHESIREDINSHSSDVVATGLANTFGNKGGCGISFCVGKTSFLFVGSHMAAHQHKVKARNRDFSNIDKNLNLQRPAGIVWKIDHENKEEANAVSDRFHYVFWLGDFNYRINGTRKAVDKMLAFRMHAALVANDQLLIEKSCGNAFDRFSEGPLNFLPTYKFDKNCDTYDSSKKARIPSWTDRILWRTNQAPGVLRLLAYDSETSVKMSDHRAVRAVFEAPLNPPTGDKGMETLRKDRKPFGSESSQICSIM